MQHVAQLSLESARCESLKQSRIRSMMLVGIDIKSSSDVLGLWAVVLARHAVAAWAPSDVFPHDEDRGRKAGGPDA